MQSALEPPDTHHLSSAIGWLGLGNWREAEADLEKITPALHPHPDVLEVRWEVEAKAKNWSDALECAQELTRLAPQRAFGWIHLAYTLHELKRTTEAYDALASVLPRFPKDWLMRYNLACYECQLANLDQAWNWLEKACDLGDPEQIKAMALEDHDLEPLHEEISEL
jgi:tetratricopeptide (TPR) repeat protein